MRMWKIVGMVNDRGVPYFYLLTYLAVVSGGVWSVVMRFDLTNVTVTLNLSEEVSR